MWNKFNVFDYEGMIAETITIPGANGDNVRAYFSRPLTPGPHPSIVLIPHMPGWDEWCRETARRFTQHGYAVVCPNIYDRYGDGYPDVVSGKVREAGGVPDDTVVGDCEGSLNFLRSHPTTNGKVGVIGMCSGGRHAFLAACKLDFDAVVDCWGGGVTATKEELTPARPVAPIDYSADLDCPILGIFGNDDFSPTPDQVNILEETLKELGKDYEFHRYDGAGHGFWYYHTPMYRQEQAMDSFAKVMDFFEKNLK